MYPRTYANYTLLERLAVGGMSEVDLACRTVDDSQYVRFVVIKRIRAEKTGDESFIRMFKDEARITSALRHTNIAQVYDFGRVDDEYYLALEYVPGINLREIINLENQRYKVIPPSVAMRILCDVLDALFYAHTRCDDLGRAMEIVHRDANPRNIMLSTNGETKLIDFGVARATDRLERTQTNHFKGKVAYMAPEQLQGTQIDGRADVFAVGLTLFELVSGRAAFKGMDPMQIMYKLLNGKMPKFQSDPSYAPIASPLEAIFKRATAQHPDERFSNCEEMRQAIIRIAKGAFTVANESEMLAYLDTLDPNLKSSLHEKIRSYSNSGTHLLPKSLSTIPRVLNDDASVTLEMAENIKAPSKRPLLVAGALGTATLASIGLMGLLLIGVAIVLVVWTPWQKSETPPVLNDMQEGLERTKADPIDDGKPTAIVNEDVKPTAPTEKKSEPKTNRTNATKSFEKAKVPDPKVLEMERTPVEPKSAPIAVTPAVDPGTETDAKPAEKAKIEKPPTLDDAVTGMLQVTSDPKGQIISINGTKTKYTTPAKITWPIGTIRVQVQGIDGEKVVNLEKDQRLLVRFP